MLRVRQWLKAALIAAMFAYGMLAVSLIMPLATRLSASRAACFNDWIRVGWSRLVCRILGVRLRVDGRPDLEAGLTVANHISWLDIIVLGSLQPLTFVSKQEVADWPVMGYLARRIGTLFIKRGDAEQTAATVEQVTWRLRQGKRLMIFPEGTTTTGERVLRFHGKLFQPAQLAHVPVQAVAVHYLGGAKGVVPFVGEDAFLPHLMNVLKLPRIDISVHYCASMPAGLHRNELAAGTRRQILEALAGHEGTLRMSTPRAVTQL